MRTGGGWLAKARRNRARGAGAVQEEEDKDCFSLDLILWKEDPEGAGEENASGVF